MATDTLNLLADLREALDRAVEAIVEIAHPRLVILFGSWAEGKAREGSDVDFVVVADTPEAHRLTVALRRALSPILQDRDFDVIVTTPELWERGRKIRGFITQEADRYGVRLHEAA